MYYEKELENQKSLIESLNQKYKQLNNLEDLKTLIEKNVLLNRIETATYVYHEIRLRLEKEVKIAEHKNLLVEWLDLEKDFSLKFSEKNTQNGYKVYAYVSYQGYTVEITDTSSLVCTDGKNQFTRSTLSDDKSTDLSNINWTWNRPMSLNVSYSSTKNIKDKSDLKVAIAQAFAYYMTKNN